MSFYVGQKVVCVIPMEPWISKDKTYTVQWVGSHCSCGPAICVGIKNTNSHTRCSRCNTVVQFDTITFDSRRFRPIYALTEQMDRIESEGAPVEQPEPAFA